MFFKRQEGRTACTAVLNMNHLGSALAWEALGRIPTLARDLVVFSHKGPPCAQISHGQQRVCGGSRSRAPALSQYLAKRIALFTRLSPKPSKCPSGLLPSVPNPLTLLSHASTTFNSPLLSLCWSPGIEANLDAINKLKLKGLVLGPLHTVQADQPNTLDFEKLDPSYGTEKDLVSVLEKTHKNGRS